MRPFLGLFLALNVIAAVAMGSSPQAPAQSASDAAAIRGVIERQLSAFQRDDSGLAYSFASPSIQRKFGTAETFMRMVKTGYPAVYRPREVEFRALQLRDDGIPVQEVLFVGPDGSARLAFYMMQRQDDGTWKIDGVYLVDAAQSTT